MRRGVAFPSFPELQIPAASHWMPQGHWAFLTAHERHKNHEASPWKLAASIVLEHAQPQVMDTPFRVPFLLPGHLHCRVWSLNLGILMLSLPPTHTDFTTDPTHSGQ